MDKIEFREKLKFRLRKFVLDLIKLCHEIPYSQESKIIIDQLGSGHVTLDTIAEKLNLSSRTVYRKLKAENVSYKDLLIKTKMQLAREYLKSSSLTLNNIAARLAFSEASSFHRAFKNWFGISPGRYR